MNTKSVLATITVVAFLPLGQQPRAQALEQQKAGAVKVAAQVDGKRRTGTGFIVRLDQDMAYILTASHVAARCSRTARLSACSPVSKATSGVPHR
jgi:S1-C subfamily serine protease